ncbi:MAG: virulence factor [Pseudomonadota bacterium]
MFALAFDLVVVETAKHHPKGVSQAYTDIANTLRGYGFNRIQGSVYVTKNEDMANLFRAIMALKKMSWFRHCIRDIRSFKIEQWSDFTSVVTEE